MNLVMNAARRGSGKYIIFEVISALVVSDNGEILVWVTQNL